MSECTKIAFKTLIAFLLRDISVAIMNSLPDMDDEDDDPVEF